ncbi:MAG: hypothetical protein U0996_12095 [Planctomycetaceae bacterium]
MECEFSRIIVTGNDRASFLHNFCTNNIRALEPGKAIEAFFTDVRARVLGFGYVIAHESRHEIWQAGPSPERLFKHLSRYVIREDVHFLVPDHDQVSILRLGDNSGSEAMPSAVAGSGDLEMMLRFSWNRHSLVAVTGQYSAPSEELTNVLQSARPVTISEFNALRIAERFPVPGIDMTDEHLAPEGGRNATAISYTKGCYLGQEPIARLDAMGHVNRLLKCLKVDGNVSLSGADVQTETGTTLGVISSSSTTGVSSLGLAILKLAHPAKTVVLSDGTKLDVAAVEPI